MTVAAPAVDLRFRCFVTGELQGAWMAEAIVTLRATTTRGGPPATIETMGRHEARREAIMSAPAAAAMASESVREALRQALFELVRRTEV